MSDRAPDDTPRGGSPPGDTPPGDAPPGDTPLTLGTAGHIDHGKTALITLLTGKNTDRLREERDRGISIELGYAELALPGGRRLSVVDVPGHERFVRAMVAGATGIDLFLLVVAADDGVMPQTVEHLAILELLGVDRGVVALTKADLVDDELLELARADVVAFLEGTRFAGTPVVIVSARDGRGVPELQTALDGVAATVGRARRDGPARLPVDRSFVLKGIGTVVTGTLWRGVLRAGDELVIEPGGRQVAVRSVEVHDRETDTATAGRRVGVNLRGVERAGVERGQWLLAPELAGRSTARFDAWLRLLPQSRPVRPGDRLRVHHGTAQYVARVVALEGGELRAGEEGGAVVRLDGGVAPVEPHDRFIVRSLSPATTVGGGVVVDARPRRWHERAAHAAFVRALHDGDAAAGCLRLAGERGAAGVGADDLDPVGLDSPDAEAALRMGEAGGGLASLAAAPDAPPHWFVPEVLDAVAERVVAALRERAAQRPQRPHLTTAEMATALAPFPSALVAALCDSPRLEGRVAKVADGYASADASGALSDEQERLAAAVAGSLADAGLSPPTLASLSEDLGVDKRALTQTLEALVSRGVVVRADKDLWFAAAAVGEARERLCEALARLPQLTLAEFRDLVGIGRRDAQALLELFDREGVTRRVGDARVLRKSQS